jgi:hypothetical protein
MVDLIQRMFTRLFKRPQPTVRPPWYTGPPTFPDTPRVFQPPPPPRQAAPPVRIPEPEPVSVYNDPLNNTRPMQRVDETRPMIPAAPVIDPIPMADITRRYDHLFPPPQPGDEDYLEFDHDDTALILPEQANAQSPSAADNADETDTEPLDSPPPDAPDDLPD